MIKLKVLTFVGLLIATPVLADANSPLEYANQKARAYSDSFGNQDIEIECETSENGNLRSIKCQSELYSVVDWGANGPQWFDRLDVCGFKFDVSPQEYKVVSEECTTEDADDSKVD